ncbi:MAG: SDR family NAD-dependent epimerase/dehydratase, partial [Bacteroidota bacterium]
NNPEATLTNKPLPIDDPKVRKPDITKAREVLGWEPQISRAEGLAKTLEYFKEQVHGVPQV